MAVQSKIFEAKKYKNDFKKLIMKILLNFAGFFKLKALLKNSEK